MFLHFSFILCCYVIILRSTIVGNVSIVNDNNNNNNNNMEAFLSWQTSSLRMFHVRNAETKDQLNTANKQLNLKETSGGN